MVFKDLTYVHVISGTGFAFYRVTLFINDGMNTFQYTAAQQERESFDAFLSRTGHTKGRVKK